MKALKREGDYTQTIAQINYHQRKSFPSHTWAQTVADCLYSN